MVNRRRVVVTGLGVISSIGIGKDAFWKSLLEGKSGVSRIERFDTSDFETHIGGEVKEFQPEDFFEKRDTRLLGRAAQFAIAATRLALEDAGIDPNTLAGSKAAVCLGTTMADAQAIEAFNEEVARLGWCSVNASRRYSLQYPSCILGTSVAAKFRLRGQVVTIPTACAAGNYAVAFGTDLIRTGKCDLVLAGGADPFSRIAFTGFNRIFAVARDRCRPFDLHRKGMVVGEGGGVIILESLDHALNRGGNLYAEILGYGTSCDAHHMTIPTVEGISRAIQNALKDAETSSQEVDYISAHGTGTPTNDRTESSAILNVFGERACQIPVSSIKSMLGHTMGAASALEGIACALAARYNKVPPTINFETKDPDCPIDCVPNNSRTMQTDVILNNSFAFGGNNACVVFGKLK